MLPMDKTKVKEGIEALIQHNRTLLDGNKEEAADDYFYVNILLSDSKQVDHKEKAR
jgi:hypothetical protein